MKAIDQKNRINYADVFKQLHIIEHPLVDELMNYLILYMESSGKYVMEPLSRIQSTKILGITLMPSNGLTEFLKINSQLNLRDALSIKAIIDNFEN